MISLSRSSRLNKAFIPAFALVGRQEVHPDLIIALPMPNSFNLPFEESRAHRSSSRRRALRPVPKTASTSRHSPRFLALPRATVRLSGGCSSTIYWKASTAYQHRQTLPEKMMMIPHTSLAHHVLRPSPTHGPTA